MDDPFDPGKGPRKIFVESFHCRVVNGVHAISLNSGSEEFRFVIPLPGSKTMARALSKQIQEIERQTGQQIPDLGLSDEPVASPVKMDRGTDDKK